MALSKPQMDTDDRQLRKWLAETADKLFYMKEYTTNVSLGALSSNEVCEEIITVKGIKSDDPTVLANITTPDSNLVLSDAQITGTDTVKIRFMGGGSGTGATSVGVKLMVMKRI